MGEAPNPDDSPGNGLGGGIGGGLGGGLGATLRRAPRRRVVHRGRRRARRAGPDPEVAVAAVATLLWGGAAVAILALLPRGAEGGYDGLAALGALVALVTPVALIWLAAFTARTARLMRDDRARIEALLLRFRHTLEAGAAGEAGGDGPAPAAPDADAIAAALAPKLDEIARAQRQAEAALTRLTGQGGPTAPPFRAQARPARPAPRAAATPPAQAAPEAPDRLAPDRPASDRPAPDQPAPDQPALGLDPPPGPRAVPISRDTFVRALNFPETEDDTAGFDALRAALRDPSAAGIVRSAQDILTLLSEDGIYMDDLEPDRARTELWRRFAQGERGGGVAPLGGVRDRAALAATAGRMRQDPVFRDVAHHFLRRFDRAFAAFERAADDAEIAALAETRTARAFMLLGRVAGTFD